MSRRMIATFASCAGRAASASRPHSAVGPFGAESITRNRLRFRPSLSSSFASRCRTAAAAAPSSSRRMTSSVPASPPEDNDEQDPADPCPPWQNPLHHNNPDYVGKVLAEDFAPGEEMPIVPLPPFDDGSGGALAPPHLHDIADDCALPFVEVPSSLPVYLPAGVFADYLDFHARIHRIDFRGGVLATAVEPLAATPSSASPAAAAAAAAASPGGSEGFPSCLSGGGDRWRVRARPVRGDEDGGASPSPTPCPSPSPLCFEARNVVFCDGGLYNSPKIPAFAREAVAARAAGTKSEFLGEVIHSSQLSAREGSCARFAGKRVLVVGFGAVGEKESVFLLGQRSPLRREFFFF